jgi:hypothetical protein
MKVENGKIVEATESELFEKYLHENYDNFMLFNDYIQSMKRLGVRIVADK